VKRSPIKRGDKPMKRTEIKRGDATLERKPMKRQRSSKVIKFANGLDKATPALVARCNGWCEAGFPPCKIVGSHRHHRQLRSQGGTNDLSNLLYVCEHCHTYGHHFPDFARRVGFIVPAGQDPAEVEFRPGGSAR
jgi:hypothetical protein